MKMGTRVTLNKSGLRNNTGDWKAHLEMSERGKDRGKTRKSQWLCLPAHKEQHGKEPCLPSDFSFPLTWRAEHQPHLRDNSWCPSLHHRLLSTSHHCSGMWPSSQFRPPSPETTATILSVQRIHSQNAQCPLSYTPVNNLEHTLWTPLRSLWERGLRVVNPTIINTYLPTLLCTRQCTKFFVWTDS